MITVSISNNGTVIYARTATNISSKNVGNNDVNVYSIDTGDIIKHTPKDSAVIIAKKMLDNVKE